MDGTLGDTLGDEARGAVVIDFEGHPTKYEELEILQDIVAKEVNVLKVDVPREGGRGWKRTFSEINTQGEGLGDEWKQNISQGAKYVLEETKVRANDPHYEIVVYIRAPWPLDASWVPHHLPFPPPKKTTSNSGHRCSFNTPPNKIRLCIGTHRSAGGLPHCDVGGYKINDC